MIFVGQTNIEISVSAGSDLTGATVQMVFRKPSGTIVKRGATIVSANTGDLKWNGSAGDNLFDIDGNWSVWLEIDYADSTKSFSKTTKIPVFNPGTI